MFRYVVLVTSDIVYRFPYIREAINAVIGTDKMTPILQEIPLTVSIATYDELSNW